MGTRKRKSEPYRSGDCILGRRGTWSVADFPNESTGKRQRVRLGCYDTEADRRKALDQFADARRLAIKQATAHTVGELWKMWLEDRGKDSLSNEIYEAHWVSLGKVFANRDASLVTRDDCRDYARARFALGRSQWTVHNELAKLRICLQWAEKCDKIAKVPPIWVPQKGKSRKRVLTFEEVKALLDGAGDPHIYLFIIMAFSTGARHMAILDLMWDRIDFERGLIAYDTDLPPDPMSKSWQKGRATVPMGAMVRAALELAYRGRRTDHVIEHGGKRLVTVRAGFAAAVARAGLDLSRGKITPHTIRHSVATWLRERSVDLARVAQLLGHADPRTTELIYSHPDAHRFIGGAVDIIDAEFHALTTEGENPSPSSKKMVKKLTSRPHRDTKADRIASDIGGKA